MSTAVRLPNNQPLEWTGPASRSSYFGSVVGAGPAIQRQSVMRQRESAIALDYSTDRLTVGGRLVRFARRRKRAILVTFCLIVVLLIAAPFALVQFGKHKWNVALANSPGPGRGLEARFDGFVFGGDHLVSAWAVRYKLVPAGQTDGFEAYLFLPSLTIDAPIFHS